MHFSRVLLGGVELTCWVEVYEVSDSIFLAGECWSAGSPGGLGEAAPARLREWDLSLACSPSRRVSRPERVLFLSLLSSCRGIRPPTPPE